VIFKQGGCELLTPPSTVTYPTNQGSTIINLAFASTELTESMIKCRIATELDHGSDHLLIASRFRIKPLRVKLNPKRCWKNLDINKAKASIANLKVNSLVHTKAEIKQYARYLSKQLYLALN
jgi:signal transduction histidine kinase